MSYNDEEMTEEQGFRISDEDAGDPMEPAEETGSFVFEDDDEELDPDRDH